MYKVFSPLISLILTAGCGTSVPAEGLVFDPSSGKAGSIELPTGETVNYTAYEKLYFVTNVEDPTYQYMNVYVPEGATQKTPIFLRTYVGGYMASEAAAPLAGALLRPSMVEWPDGPRECRKGSGRCSVADVWVNISRTWTWPLT